MATVYSALGARIDVVEMLDGLMQGPDRDLVKVWEKYNSHRFDNVMVKTRTVKAEASEQGIWVSFEGEKAPAEPQCYDLVLVAVGRKPNGNQIDADKAGITVGERGFIAVDKQMRTNVPHIFAIGDIVGQPMLAHKAVHEGHVAAEVAAGEALSNAELARSTFDALQIPGVAYTNPEVAGLVLLSRKPRTRASRSRPRYSPGPLQAGRLPMVAMRASPSCCSMPRPIGWSVAASSAPARAT